MQPLIRDAFTLVWEAIVKSHPRAKAAESPKLTVPSATVPSKAETKPTISQDASPPGTKIRWWT